jgi:hypothetical protein
VFHLITHFWKASVHPFVQVAYLYSVRVLATCCRSGTDDLSSVSYSRRAPDKVLLI